MFEWDEEKREKNIAKHGIDFLKATRLFDGSKIFTFSSSKSSEERFGSVGIIDDVIITIIWTKRKDKIRIISVRRARNEEKRKYSQLFGK